MDPIEYLFCPRCVFFGVMFDSFQMVSSPCWRISLPFFQPSIFAYLSCILQEHLKQEWCLNIIASWKNFPFFSCALICVCCRLSIFVQIFCTQKITSYNQHICNNTVLNVSFKAKIVDPKKPCCRSSFVYRAKFFNSHNHHPQKNH